MLLASGSGDGEEGFWRDLVCWIDPLDGTKEFVIGDLRCVTCLIGLSYKREAFAGVIAEPFK